MANNIAVSITADVADLQVKRAIMSAGARLPRTSTHMRPKRKNRDNR
jgi:hypothetical protein